MDSTHWADCWKVHEACAVSRRALAARPCTCHLCPPGIGCAPCWARETLGELIDGHAFVPDDLGDHGWPSYTCAVCGKRKAEHIDGEAS